MHLFRQLMILSLMPLTALSGMPDVACRCSNGEIRLHCPKLNQPKSVVNHLSDGCASKSGDRKSCCGGGGASRSCCQSAKRAANKSDNQSPSCCAETCHCTPVIVEGNSGAKLNAENVPVLSDVEFLPVLVSVVRLPRLTRVDLVAIDSGPDQPDDLIVLFERFLI
jgi:hypothetical protein